MERMGEDHSASNKRGGLLRRLYGWAAERLYHELAWAYDPVSWVVSLGRWSYWRRTALEHLPAGRVLEIGPGTGVLLAEMARRGLAVCGLEPSPAMLRLAARRLRRLGLRVPLVRGRAQALPFLDATFDAVLATFPANYILSAETLREAARVLRSGRLVVAGLVSESRGPSTEAMLVRWAHLAAEVGFAVTEIPPAGGGDVWPVFVLEKGDHGLDG